MRRKIFINIFFEKRNALTVYIAIITLFTMFLGVQTIFLGNQLEKSNFPDMEIYGAPDEDGVMRFKLYNDIGDVPQILEDETNGGVRFQSVIIRNLLTVSDNFNQVQYRVIGMLDSDIALFSKYMKSGQIPQADRKEVLLGSYAARYFGVDVGDRLDLKLTLSKDNMDEPEGEYVVSGILNDNQQYYKGSIIISKETWQKENMQVKDNMLYLYMNSEDGYKNVLSAIESLDDQNARLINIANNYSATNSAKSSIMNSIVVICAISLIVIALLFFFLMRGMGKKIGLLKALGLPEKKITQILCGGLLIITIIAVVVSLTCEFGVVTYMNAQATKFYGFKVKEYSVNKYAILAVLSLNIINMMAASITVTWFGKKISPRDAMLKA